VENSCQRKGASGFGRSGIMWVYALRHHKPRSPDEVRLCSRSHGHVDREPKPTGLAHGKGRINIGDRDFEMTKSLDIKNPDFTKCEIASESGPSDPEMIRTIDFLHIRVSGIAICSGKETIT